MPMLVLALEERIELTAGVGGLCRQVVLLRSYQVHVSNDKWIGRYSIINSPISELPFPYQQVWHRMVLLV
jgi:hypothetical protein